MPYYVSLFQLTMPKKHHRTRAERRRAVHQAMRPGSDSTPARGSSRVTTTSASSKVSKASRVAATSASPKGSKVKSVRQPLLSLIPQLILASININGLCPETEWAVSSILEGQHYDVSAVPLYSCTFLPLSGSLFK